MHTESKTQTVIWKRKIIHIDMDAFFASVEQRDEPSYRGKPVIVGGSPDSRGVVSACSYEARRFGVHSAMASSKAHRLCPQAIFVKPRFVVYKQVSQCVMSILRQHTHLVESVSLDEAYLDVTTHKLKIEDPVMIATLIKQNIAAATGLTASAGVASYMYLAKIASDFHKPDGLTVVLPGEEALFLENLPVRKIPGVGPVTEKQLLGLGIKTCGDLAVTDPELLLEHFGRYGASLREKARGHENREVEPCSEPKQVSCEETFEYDIRDIDFLEGKLEEFAREIYRELQITQRMGMTIVLKVKYFDFEQITRSQTLDHEPLNWKEVHRVACQLLESKTKVGKKSIRLIGLGISGLKPLSEFRARHTPDLFSEAALL